MRRWHIIFKRTVGLVKFLHTEITFRKRKVERWQFPIRVWLFHYGQFTECKQLCGIVQDNLVKIEAFFCNFCRFFTGILFLFLIASKLKHKFEHSKPYKIVFQCIVILHHEDINNLKFQLIACLRLPIKQFKIINLKLFGMLVLHCYPFEAQLMIYLTIEGPDLPVLGGVEDYLMDELANVQLKLNLFWVVDERRFMFYYLVLWGLCTGLAWLIFPFGYLLDGLGQSLLPQCISPSYLDKGHV